MLKFIWDWAVLAPANIVADLVAAALGISPFAAGIGAAGILVYNFFAKEIPLHQSHKWQLLPALYAWVAGLFDCADRQKNSPG
jgi:hypothetical protein